MLVAARRYRAAGFLCVRNHHAGSPSPFPDARWTRVVARPRPGQESLRFQVAGLEVTAVLVDDSPVEFSLERRDDPPEPEGDELDAVTAELLARAGADLEGRALAVPLPAGLGDDRAIVVCIRFQHVNDHGALAWQDGFAVFQPHVRGCHGGWGVQEWGGRLTAVPCAWGHGMPVDSDCAATACVPLRAFACVGVHEALRWT